MISPRRDNFTFPTLALAALLAVALAACSASAASQDTTTIEAIDVISVSGDIDGDSVGGAESVPDSYGDLATRSTTENDDVVAETVSLLSSTTSTHADLGEGCDI